MGFKSGNSHRDFRAAYSASKHSKPFDKRISVGVIARPRGKNEPGLRINEFADQPGGPGPIYLRPRPRQPRLAGKPFRVQFRARFGLGFEQPSCALQEHLRVVRRGAIEVINRADFVAAPIQSFQPVFVKSASAALVLLEEDGQPFLRERHGGQLMGCNRRFNLEHWYEPLSRVLHSDRRCFTLRAVNRLRFIIAPLLVVLWLPASSHALLEHWELIHQVQSDHEPGPDDSDTDNHDAADGICHIAPTAVQVQQPDWNAGLQLAPESFLLAFIAPGEAPLVLRNGPDPPGVAPPELLHTWQFSFRTSLPPRAPSVIS